MNILSWLGLCTFAIALAPTQAAAQQTPARLYAASSDLHEFVDRRASAPNDGSFFYAYWARWECFDDGGIARRVAKESPPLQGSAQAEAVRVQLERCRNMPAELSAGELQREDVQAGRVAGDKLFAGFTGNDGSWFSVRDESELRHALGFISSHTDPNMVWVVAQQVAGLGATRRIRVEGSRPSEAEARSLYVAFLLAACDVNVDCGTSHRWMRVWCIQNGECSDATIEAYWKRRDFDAKDKMNWAVIAKYRTLISRAVKAADWSAFGLIPSTEQ